MKVCRKCGNFYNTPYKKGKICDVCKYKNGKRKT